MVESIKELLEIIETKYKYYDAIVVEGYDGVGKGRVLSNLSSFLGVIPYRPDYNLWQQYDLRKTDRWKISGFFWDVFSHFYKSNFQPPMLFDRGILSGAVYNNDMRIASDYKKLLRDMKVLHILVECSKDDFIIFQKIRDNSISYDRCKELWSEYQSITESYMEAIDTSGVEYLIYLNKFDEKDSERLENTCAGCGHYNYGWCRHPSVNIEVNGENTRCQYSNDKEVQDTI